MEEGGAAEVGMVGTEGVLGVFHLLGSAKPPTSCMIQSNATGYRISLSDFQELFDQRSDIRVRVLEFVQEQAFTANQVAGCHRLHEAEERLSRWLLMAADRASSNTLYLTHEFLAEMLGSRRSTVTIAAGLLQRVGIIEYSRGRVEIVSRERLEESACCCYRTVRKLYDNLYSSALPDERRVSR
jgi:CRP-like cAMP-binding protein